MSTPRKLFLRSDAGLDLRDMNFEKLGSVFDNGYMDTLLVILLDLGLLSQCRYWKSI